MIDSFMDNSTNKESIITKLIITGIHDFFTKELTISFMGALA